MDAPAPLHHYQYQPLESYTTIRVLVLQPAEDLYAPLKVQLVHVQGEALLLGYGTVDFYDAVSYCWGEPTLSHVLVVNEDSTLGITSNADTLLRHLRSSSKSRYLWIDAICLNQEDRTEKQIQVQRMGRIYAQAAKVRIWVGTATEHQHVSQLYNALKWLAIRLKNKEAPAPTETKRFLETTCGRDWEHAINQFFARPYFLRRWILQEVVLGHHITIHCGPWKLSWQWFIQGVRGLQRAITLGLRMDLKADDALYSILAIENSDNERLLDLLWRFHQCQCSVPHDKIFALYGLARDAKEITDVDYSRHWSDTFTRVAGAYFQRDKKSVWLHLAHFGSLSGTGPEGLPYPSWVPNWNNTRSCAPLVPDNNAALLSFSGFKYSQFFYDPDLRAVKFDSYYAGRIENISTLCMGRTPGPKQQKEMVWDEGKILALSEVLLAFFLLPSGSLTVPFRQALRTQEKSFDNDLQIQSWRETLLQIFQEVGPWSCKPAASRSHAPLQAIVSSILDAIWNEHDILHIHGKRDAIGLSPEGTQSGDILVVPPQGPTKIATNSVYWPYKGHPLFGIVVKPVSESLHSSGTTIYTQNDFQANQKLELHGCRYRYRAMCSFSLWKQDCEEELDKIQLQLV